VTPVRCAFVVAALGATAWLLVDPHSADLAAQEYRAGLVRDHGFGVWDNGWFAGHHTPAYSVLFPPLGAVLGVRAAGALAAIAAAALFGLIAERRWGKRAGALAAAWFAAGATATLVSGRLTFLLGVVVALAATLALQRGRPAVATALAVLATLASPVAALFLALAAVAWGLSARSSEAGRACARSRRAWSAAVAVAALAPSAALAALFPEGGSEPFAVSAFWPALLVSAIVAVVLPARERALRVGAGLYGLGCVAAFVLATPLGGNVTRLGALLAGPVVAGALLSAGPDRAPRRGWRTGPALIALALALVYWQGYPAVRDVVRASGDLSTTAAYHAPLIRYLQRRPGTFRVEIPYTANHWENAHVAPYLALARGWERQLDRRYGALFYDGSLNAATYRAWLDEHAVAYVALPDVVLDNTGRDEARLVQTRPSYLHQVWHDAHWRVFAVRRPAPLASGVADAIDLDAHGFTIHARRRGDALVRVRHSRWWTVTSGRACVRRASTGMTRVRVLAPGTARVQARLRGSTCRR
jgi:hypothetical protein